jgi:hypothetical protein
MMLLRTNVGLAAMLALLPGCRVVGGVFKAGVWAGIIAVVLVMVLVGSIMGTVRRHRH